MIVVVGQVSTAHSERPMPMGETMPDTPATTLDEIVAALGSQATRDASEPVDITVDGYAGKSITSRCPMARHASQLRLRRDVLHVGLRGPTE